jgi:hypothetical protein
VKREGKDLEPEAPVIRDTLTGLAAFPAIRWSAYLWAEL